MKRFFENGSDIKKYADLQKLGYFPLGLCTKLISPRQIVLSTTLVVVVVDSAAVEFVDDTYMHMTVDESRYDTIRHDTICYFNVRSKANMSQLNLPHGTDN